MARRIAVLIYISMEYSSVHAPVISDCVFVPRVTHHWMQFDEVSSSLYCAQDYQQRVEVKFFALGET